MPNDLADPPDNLTTAEPTPANPPRLEYNQPPGVSRRQMSLLLLFLAINTILFAAFVCLPTASPYIKSLYEDWQRSRAEKKKTEQLKSIVNACLTHTLPPDQVVYAEPPDDATKLLTGNGRARVVEGIARNGGGGGGAGSLVATFTASGWRPPAYLAKTEPFIGLYDRLPDLSTCPAEFNDDNVCFLHARKTPSGKERLVWVSAFAKQAANGLSSNGAEQTYSIQNRRRLTAHVWDPGNLTAHTLTSIVFQESDDDRSFVAFPRDRDASGNFLPGRFQPRGQWRIRAAQPDVSDPTHFTIPYDIDGKPGVIDAHLNEGDRLLFTPRTGRLIAWTSGNEYLWELTPAATTAPTRLTP